MARKGELEKLLEELARLPWWVSVAVAIVAYVAMSAVLPRVAGDNPLIGPLVDAVSKFAWLIAALFLIPAAASAFRGIRNRRMVAANQSIEAIQALDWKEFEDLVEAYYRREGFDVLREGGHGPDGGVDLRLRRRGETWLVQCKQYRTRPVGVPVVRELAGVVSAELATGGIVVTAGSFTAEAERFATSSAVHIQLVDGAGLVTMVADAAEETAPSAPGPQIGKASGSPLANADILRLTSAGVGATAIIAKIESSTAEFDVSVEKMVDLAEAGVAEAVIAAMVTAARGNR